MFSANIVLSVMLCTFVHLLDMFVGFLVLIGTSVCCLAPSSRSYALVLPTLRLSESFTSPLAHIVHSPATFVTPLTTRVAYLLYQVCFVSRSFCWGVDIFTTFGAFDLLCICVPDAAACHQCFIVCDLWICLSRCAHGYGVNHLKAAI
ncbi:hypothetical protein V8B97DRAFT_791746 [Scleroderma yunnanense]